jgi:arabinofuranosyltransferase
MRKDAPAWAALAALAAALGALAGRFWFVCDDAYISFRYARHLAAGRGLVFNLGEDPPVEGFSNLLWVLLAAGFEAIGVAPAAAVPFVSLGAAVVLVVATWAIAERRLGLTRPAALTAAAVTALAPHTVVWASSGLETAPEALLLVIALDGLALDARPRAWARGAVAAIALSLLRTEGVGWAVVLLGLRATIAAAEAPTLPWRPRLAHAARAVARPAAAVLAATVMYAAWRYGTFHSLVSNTAKAKVGFGAERVGRGLAYVGGFSLATVTPPLVLLLGAPGAWRLGPRGRALFALALGVPLFAVVVGGDFMAMGRLLVPGTALAALSFAATLDRVRTPARRAAAWLGAACLIGLGLLPLADVHLAPESARRALEVRLNTAAFRSEIGQWRFMRDNAVAWSRLGRALAQVERPGDSIVLGGIGAVGYHTELFVHDRYGLVSPEVTAEGGDGHGHSPGHDKYVPISFFLDQSPTILRATLLPPQADDAMMRARLSSWSYGGRAARSYAPRAVRVELDGARPWLVTLQRSDDAAADQAAFEATWGVRLR